MAQWRASSDAAERAVAEVLDGASAVSEPFVARTLLRSLPTDCELVAASSMPVRDLEWYGVPRPDVRVRANRGANGIDGTIATAIGVAASARRPTAVLLGDVAFLHDSTALIGITDREVDLTIVVVDNNGGGIFSFLPQASAIDAGVFEDLFGTPHGVDVRELASVHGIASSTVENPNQFETAVRAATDRGGVELVVVRTDRTENVKVHQQLNDAVADAVRASGTNER
jgi:2-succinyl-5-enolpyruvyl-6-hydroxy-3-cyclohexene-1-carboxylate synthase